MTKTVDFDQFRQEQDAEPIEFKIGGDTYSLAPTIPAAMVLKIIRLQNEIGPDAQVTLEVFDALGRSVFGPQQWDEILEKHHLGYQEMPELVQAVMSAYVPKADQATNAPTSATKESSSASSKAGRGSKRTS